MYLNRNILDYTLLDIPTVVIDLETTGLSTKTDRIIQIAAVKMRGKEIRRHSAFDVLINPNYPINPESQKVLSITQEQLEADGVPLIEVLDEFHQFVQGSLMVGCSFWFDANVMRAEWARHGISFNLPPYIDILDIAAACDIQAQTFDALREYFGVSIKHRHDAYSDTIATAEVYVKMLDMLQAKGRVTVRSAITPVAGGSLPSRFHEEGLVEKVDFQVEDLRLTGGMRDIDSVIYQRKVSEVATGSIVYYSPENTLRDLAAYMKTYSVDFVVVGSPKKIVGVLSEHDMLQLSDDYNMSVRDALTRRQLLFVEADALLYRAILIMKYHKVRHLLVRTNTGVLSAVLSLSDLMETRLIESLAWFEELEHVNDVAKLKNSYRSISQIAAKLRRQFYFNAKEVSHVISNELCALTARCCRLVQIQMEKEFGPHPGKMCVLMLGSAAREECLLASDQDNALVYELAPEDDEKLAEKWYQEFAERVCDLLAKSGLPLCKGGVMMRNSLWRATYETWQERIFSWTKASNSAELLAVDIFFDAKPVYGKLSIGYKLCEYMHQLAGKTPNLLIAMSSDVAAYNAPIGFWGKLLQSEANSERINLKSGVTSQVASLARLLSLRFSGYQRNTISRLQASLSHVDGSKSEWLGISELYETCLQLILDQQLQDASHARVLSVDVDFNSLTKVQAQQIKTGMRDLEIISEQIKGLLK